VSRRTPMRSAWWSRSRGLPPAVYAAWVRSLAVDRARSRILAWAPGPGSYAIASVGGLAVGSGAEFRQLGWHEIERGGWDVERGRLTWKLYDAGREHVELTEPGRIPEVFRERVAASIAMEKFVPLTGERGVVVTARRDLTANTPPQWHATLTRGLRWDTPGVAEAVDTVLGEVRREYDLG
jgi:hypothetical protein